jgi:hypothetical protein
MKLSIVTVVLVLSIFFGCESPTGPGTNSTSVNTDEIPAEYMFNDSLAIDTVPYQLVGTSYSDYGRRFRIASFKEREIREVSRDCRDDTLVVQYDTTDSRTDTTSVFIRKDTLFTACLRARTNSLVCRVRPDWRDGGNRRMRRRRISATMKTIGWFVLPTR